MTAKEKAEELVDKYDETLIYLPRFVAKQCALIAVENEYHSLREQLFNLKSCSVDIPEKVYLFRIQALINEEQEVKIEIQEL